MEFVLNPEVPIEKYFEEMTRIPHGSFHEKEYSDYLVRFARTHGLSWEQDAIGNVVIRKGGTAGYEDHPVMILQAHMDMVWAKDSGSGHDFEKEPLKLYMEDGFLYARGTTLGADDGTGVSYMLAILESDGSGGGRHVWCKFPEQGRFEGQKVFKPGRRRRRIHNDCRSWRYADGT